MIFINSFATQLKFTRFHKLSLFKKTEAILSYLTPNIVLASDGRSLDLTVKPSVLTGAGFERRGGGFVHGPPKTESFHGVHLIGLAG